MRHTPQWMGSGSYAATLDRRLIAALWPTGGTSGLAVTPTGVGIGVNIASGYAAVPSGNNTGTVLCYSDASEVMAMVPVLTPGMRRFDVVYVQPRGPDYDGSPQTDFVFAYGMGVEGATPPEPSAPAGTLPLAMIQHLHGDITIGPIQIRDMRPGGIPPSGGGGDPGGVVLYQQGLPGGRYTVTSVASYPPDLTKTFPTKPGRWYRAWLFIWADNNGSADTNWTCNLDFVGAAANLGAVTNAGRAGAGALAPIRVGGADRIIAEHWAVAAGAEMTFRVSMQTTASTLWLYQGINFAKLLITEIPDARGLTDELRSDRPTDD